MTVPAFYYPSHLKGEQLDAFLADGWYRMFQSVFTTNYIIEKQQAYRVFWLRYNLQQLQFGKTQKQLIQKNRGFHTEIKPVKVTGEIEELYALYKSVIDFEGPASVKQWLFEDQNDGNVYDTEMIEIRHNGQLIAVGIFDKGCQSIAGIMNFYHPDYRKYSPGKYLMLQKIVNAQTQQKKWYYPGYIVQGYPKFDYKLFADKESAEFYVPEIKKWLKYTPEMFQDIAHELNSFKLDSFKSGGQ